MRKIKKKRNQKSKAQTVAATLMQPCVARNTCDCTTCCINILHVILVFNLEIQCYSEIHLNITHTHNAQSTRGKRGKELFELRNTDKSSGWLNKS